MRRLRRSRALALASLLALAGLAAQAQPPIATSPSYRVEPAITSGSTTATSTSFRLDGCLDHQPAGVASSTSFQVQAGCGASLIEGAGGGVQEIPTLSDGALGLLAALLGLGALRFLRRRTTAAAAAAR